MLAAAFPSSRASTTSARSVERKRSTPNAAIYRCGFVPPENAARLIDKLWCSIDLKTRKPVSDVFRDSKITSTRSGFSSRLFKLSNFFIKKKALPGARGSCSLASWYLE